MRPFLASAIGLLPAGIPASVLESVLQLGTAVLSFFVLRWLEGIKRKDKENSK